MFESQILEDSLDDDVHLLELVVVGGGDEAWHELLSVHAAHLLALNLLVDAGLNLKVTSYNLQVNSYKMKVSIRELQVESWNLQGKLQVKNEKFWNYKLNLKF